MADETRRGRGIDDGFYLDTPAVHDDLGIPTPAIHDEIGVPVMADETHDTPPMTDERLAEIRQAHAETRAEMDAWYTAHPNPQWRREHPFDADSVVANTHIYITIPALLAEVERLRTEVAYWRSMYLGSHD